MPHKNPRPAGGRVPLRESAAPPTTRPPELTRERVEQEHPDTAGLREQAVPLSRISLQEATDGSNLTRFTADIAVCDVINRNMRYYPRSAFEAFIARAGRQLEEGDLTALLEHPDWDDPWKGRMENVAGRWTALGIEERDVEWPVGSGTTRRLPVFHGEGVFIDTAKGRDLKALLAGGVKVGISTNGHSTVQYQRAGDLDPNFFDPDAEIPVIQDDLQLLTIDFVSDPSNLGGRTTHAENVRRGDPPAPAAAEAAPTPEPEPPAPAPAPIPAQSGKEKYMHPKLKALLERLGKTLEQVKSENASDYLACLEDIAAEEHGLHESAGRVPGLQNEVARLQTELREANERADNAERERQRTQRESLVDAALSAANLPQLDPYKDGDQEIDLNAEFRKDLVAEAVAADSDEAARKLVDRRVAERRHLLGSRPATSAPAAPAKGPRLPVLDDDAAAEDELMDFSESVDLSDLADIVRG